MSFAATAVTGYATKAASPAAIDKTPVSAIVPGVNLIEKQTPFNTFATANGAFTVAND